jgi:zinc protease
MTTLNGPAAFDDAQARKGGDDGPPKGGHYVRSAKGLAPVRGVLANGVRVIAKETRTTPAVTIHAAIEAGTVFDPADQCGLAHFVSRTIDRGTQSLSADQIAEELDSRGVSLSVAVNRHVLTLVCTCLVEDFHAVLSLVADIIVHPRFPASEVETRRGEIITLIRQDEDNPATVATERVMAMLYGETHPYGRPARGTVKTVEQIGRPALERFHAARVVPGALSLALIGDVDPQMAIDATSHAFGGWQGRRERATLSLPLPPEANERRISVVPMMNKAQADIAYAFTSVVRSDPRYYACWLMNNILGQYSLGGRLGDSIRERQGMAYYIFSALDANVIPGPLMIRAGVNESNVDRAIASIDTELSKLATDGPTEREATESKQYLIGSMPRNLETNIGIANFLQTAEFFGLGLDYDLRVPELLRAVTREDVHAVARALLDPAKAAVAVAGPYAGPAT